MTSPSTPAAPAPVQRLQTDVRRTRGLQAGQILARRSGGGSGTTTTTADQGDGNGDPFSSSLSSTTLAEEETRLNKKIDEHVRLLETSFADLLSTLSVQDKSASRLELEAFMADYRADVMVRSVQGLSRLSKALRLSCLLVDGGRVSEHEHEERDRLEEEIMRDRDECARILARVVGGREGE